MRRSGAFVAALVLVGALAAVLPATATAAELSTDVAALVSGAGKVSVATEGSPQWGVEVYLAGSGQQLQWGLDVWDRVYKGSRWAGLAIGWRSLREPFAVLTAQSGYRFIIASDAFLDAGVGLQVRTTGFVGIVPRIYFGWKW